MPCYGDLHRNHEHFSNIQDIYLNGYCHSVVNVPLSILELLLKALTTNLSL